MRDSLLHRYEARMVRVRIPVCKLSTVMAATNVRIIENGVVFERLYVILYHII